MVVGQVWMELEMSSERFLNWWEFILLLQLVSFTVDGDPPWPTAGVDRNTSHVIFSCTLHVWLCPYSLHGSRRAKPQCVCCARFLPSSSYPWCAWAFVGCSLSVSACLSFSCFSPSSTSSPPHSTWSLPGAPSSMSTPLRVETTALTKNEECCAMAIYNPLTEQHEHAVLVWW